MTPVRIALCLIVAVFVGAEVARPTHVPAKRLSAHALVLHSQSTLERNGVSDSLDPNLLADLPRIHPDAAGDVVCAMQGDGSFRLSGTLHGDDDGSAVFVISDNLRLGAEATIFRKATRPHTFIIEIAPQDLGPGTHRLHVALVSSDQRGFFLLPRGIAVTVGSSHESSDCGRRPLALGVARASRAKL